MDNLFTRFQEALADRLRAEEWLASAPAPRIVSERVGDIGSAIDKELGGLGLCIAIATPEIGRGSETIPDEMAVEVLVDVSERPLNNRGASGTRKPAVDVVQVVIANLWNQPILPGFSRLEFTRSNLVSATPDRVTYEIRFTTRIWVGVTTVQDTEA